MKLACILLLLAVFSGSAQASTMESFFGDYRTESYNGVENTYSAWFFMPSVNQETSNKNRRPGGNFFKTLNFNFEVPVVLDDQSIYLRFIFFEAFLGASEIKEIPNGIELRFEGPVLRSLEDMDGEQLCNVRRTTRLTHLDESRIEIQHDEETQAPCKGESHWIRARRVDWR